MSDKLPSFLGITPFGVYCKSCKMASFSISTGILMHGKDCHPGDEFKNGVVIREVQRQMTVLRELHADDLSPFLTDKLSLQPTWFCTKCFSGYAKAGNYNRHLIMRGSTCTGAIGGRMTCYQTICGRNAPRSCNLLPSTPMATLTIVSESTTVSTLTDHLTQASTNQSLVVEPSSKVPATLLSTEEEACAILSPFVRADEDVRDLCMIYYPLLTPGFEGTMKEYYSYSANQPAEDGILFKWLEAGREWLGKYAAGHIANVSANVRARLAEFEQKELDGVVVGTRTFTLRRGIKRLMSELDAALRFFYRYPTALFDKYKSIEIRNSTTKWMIESAIIPKILFTAAAEEPEDHGRLPVACIYALSRGFSFKNGDKLLMNECGWFASRLAALLHLLRAGVCGYLVTLSGKNLTKVLTLQEMEIVGQIQNGRVTNLLAPYVKRLRDLNSRKPTLKTNTVNINGDVTTGSFTFPHSIWSTLIPRVVSIARVCFEEIFENDKWKLFLDKPINMTDWVRLQASVVNDTSQVWLEELGVKGDVEPLLARLESIAELCFLGLGVGAVRHEEVLRLTVLSCQWHNSYLYFCSESIKRGSLKASSSPKMVEHRLSLGLSRIVLLIRYVMTVSSEFDKKMLFPNYPATSMLGVVQDIFDFDCQPQMLHVRHLFTSIGNVIMPENSAFGNDGCLVSMSFLTEKSGHTQGTGRRAYGTWLENSEEALYDRFHSHLGEVTMDPPPVDFMPFSVSVLKAALKELIGRKAVFRSQDQKKMIQIAANSIVRHAFVGLSCGQGKSMSWMVPTMASYLSGRHVGLRIVILPYKFLLGHMVHYAIAMLGLLKEKLRVHFLDSSEIDKGTFPDVLCGTDMPALLFLNLDGAATMLRFHLERLQSLVQQNILKRVYLDELQQLVVEHGFRPSYQCLRNLGRLGVPVMCLSGSLTLSIGKSLMSYCGLSPALEGDSLDIVKPSDPIGEGFSFHVDFARDVANTIVAYVLESRIGACHVLCASIPMVNAISKKLSETLKVLSITGDSGSHEQIRCAKNWSKGEYDVLVSTVVGLVGNENHLCKTIVVGGFLFNISSLVQAIGRLRPNQRGPDTKVQVYCFPFRSLDYTDDALTSESKFKELCHAGCLRECDKDEYQKIFAPSGLRMLLSMKEGCYLQELSGYYGFARLRCNRCGLCEGRTISSDESRAGQGIRLPCKQGIQPGVLNPYKKRPADIQDNNRVGKVSRPNNVDNVALSQHNSDEANKILKLMKRETKWVLGELLYQCMVCRTVECNGELCLRGCYRCGDRSHSSNGCTFTTIKLEKILANKGVCFGCYDTLQHTMIKHDQYKCPLKKRLKRLFFKDRESNGMDHEAYLRKVYASEMSFVTIVASYATDTVLGRVWARTRKDPVVFECIQVALDASESPLLPPDVIQNSTDISCDGTPRSTSYNNVDKARSEFNILRSGKLSCRRQRQFVFGAVYESIFPGYHEVNPIVSDYDLIVKLPSGQTTVIKVRLVSPIDGKEKINLISSIVKLGRSLKCPGNSRGSKVGDIGKMHAIGLKSASSKELFKSSEEITNKASIASSVMREWMEDNMRDVLSDLLTVDKNLNITNPPSMPRGPGSRMMFSVNLANSPHYDSGDTSMSVAIWAEEKPGQSENWYFVLPNVSILGSKGVIVKLVHGVVISWDGRKIYHGSSKPKTGNDNKVFGCMWGSTKD